MDRDPFYKHVAKQLSNTILVLSFAAGVAVMGSVWAIFDASRTREEAIDRANEAVLIARTEADRAVRNYEILMVYVRRLSSQMEVTGIEVGEMPTSNDESSE